MNVVGACVVILSSTRSNEHTQRHGVRDIYWKKRRHKQGVNFFQEHEEQMAGKKNKIVKTKSKESKSNSKREEKGYESGMVLLKTLTE